MGRRDGMLIAFRLHFDCIPHQVRNPTNRTRWGIVSEGADFGEMVVRVEANPPPPLAKATPIHPEPTWKGECI